MYLYILQWKWDVNNQYVSNVRSGVATLITTICFRRSVHDQVRKPHKPSSGQFRAASANFASIIRTWDRTNLEGVQYSVK